MRSAPGWRRLLAVGCSHGHLVSPQAREGVLRFRQDWRPDTVIHLGDFLDLTCFRSGAVGGSDEGANPMPDMSSGIAFLKELRPSMIFCGNHEDRLWKLRDHPKAIVAALAGMLVDEIETVAKQLRAELVPYDYRAWRQVADCRFMHGTIFSESCVRDTAEAFAPPGGAVVFAHSHRCGMARGRRGDNPIGFNTGTLANIERLDYAKTRRQTLAWSGGFVWGIYNHKRTVLWLHDNGQEKSWRLPPV
jgi:hypothetical protein